MKLYIKIFVFALFVMSGPAMAEDFSRYVEDLPLMPQMQELADQSTVFDTPAGRIIEVHAVSNEGGAYDILTYYQETLPSMGWAQIDQNIFSRSGERLKIDTEQLPNKIHVIFTLTPLPN